MGLGNTFSGVTHERRRVFLLDLWATVVGKQLVLPSVKLWRSYICRSQFFPLSLSDHPFLRQYSEKNSVPHFKLQIPPSIILVALLLTLSCLHSLPDHLDFLIHILDPRHIFHCNDFPFSHFIPIQWCLTLSPIQSFIRGHSNGSLVVMVVSKRDQC